METSKTKDVSQQVENDANPLSLESSTSVRIIPRGHRVMIKQMRKMLMMKRVKNRLWVMFPTAVERPRRNTRRPGWLTTYMVVAYALPVVEEAIPSTFREARISSESKM